MRFRIGAQAGGTGATLGTLALALLGPAARDAKAQLTPQHVARIEWIQETALSPDGRWVAYIRSMPAGPGKAAEGRRPELLVVPAAGGTPRSVIAPRHSPAAPAWSPDGTVLAFLGRFEDQHAERQVYATTVTGEKPRALTRVATGVRSFAFSPDGRSLAFLSPDPAPEALAERERAGFDATVYGEPGRHVRLWVMGLADRAPRPVTPPGRTVRDFAWSPRGDAFAIQVTDGTDLSSDWNFRRLYAVPAAGGQPALLARTEGPLGTMAWSPDGRWLAFVGATSLRDPAPQCVFVVPAGGGEAADRTAGYEGSAVWVDWLDGSTVLFGAIEGTRTVLNAAPAAGGAIRRVMGGAEHSFTFLGFDVDPGISLDASRRTFAAPLSTAAQAEEVYVGTFDGARPRRLTHHSAFLESVRLPRQETITWTGADGLRIEGVLMHPLDAKPGARYPLVVVAHGGPERASLDAWFGLTWPQSPRGVFAARGYAVLSPNFRGSIGRGVAFSRANHRDMGGREMEDILRGIDHLVQKGLVDGSRVAIQGQSHGGYLAALAAGRHSRRFRAAMASAPVTNWASYIGAWDNALHTTLAHWDLWWFEHPGLLWDRSPVAHVRADWTPLLIDHGLLDAEVPFQQGKELFQALRLAGATTKLVLYPREGHDYVEEPHLVDVIERYLEWLDTHMQATPPAAAPASPR